MRRIHSFFLLILSLVLVHCQRELAYTGQPDPGVIVPEPITATVQGNIVDENDLPAQGVNITIGSKTAVTNASGYFRISDASLDKISAVVSAEKGGYFKAFRTFSATSGVNQVSIKLIKKVSAGTVNGAAGGDATLANGAKISLKANGVINATTGAAYTGAVTVYAAYIDPSASDITDIIPGSFMAVDKSNQRVTLSSYGMMAVELEGSAGEKLQVKSGLPATLNTPIPTGAQSSAPASIALWYVDEKTGLWKEEGTATKQGANYVGEVAHFTYWNCDVPGATVTLSFKLQNASGEPIVHADVRIKRAEPNTYGSAHGYTDSIGQVRGLIPANKALVLEVYDRCGKVIYSQNIGPYTQNTDLGSITIPSSTQGYVRLEGKLLTCTGTPVKNGYAVININNTVRYAHTDSLGIFRLSLITCSTSSASYSVYGVDVSALQQSTTTTGTLTTPSTAVGSITACGVSASQYINYSLDGVSYSITAPADSLVAYTAQVQGTTNWRTNISGTASATNILTFNFNSASKAAGSYPISELRVGNFRNNIIVTPFNINITNFPQAVGEFYEGNFNGQFRDTASNAVHNLSSTFRVRKNF